MKEIKTKYYLLILYVSIVMVDIIKLVIAVLNGTNRMPFGWTGEFGVILFKNVIEVAIVYLIGMGVDFVLKKFLKKTLIPNIVITVGIYEIIYTLLDVYTKA